MDKKFKRPFSLHNGTITRSEPASLTLGPSAHFDLPQFFGAFRGGHSA